MASESPEMLERLRERFLRALSELTSGGAMGEGKPAMVSEVAQGAGLDPERDPGDKALSERLAAELVEGGYVSAEADSSGLLVITHEGERSVSRERTVQEVECLHNYRTRTGLRSADGRVAAT